MLFSRDRFFPPTFASRYTVSYLIPHLVVVLSSLITWCFSSLRRKMQRRARWREDKPGSTMVALSMSSACSRVISDPQTLCLAVLDWYGHQWLSTPKGNHSPVVLVFSSGVYFQISKVPSWWEPISIAFSCLWWPSRTAILSYHFSLCYRCAAFWKANGTSRCCW